MKRLLKSPGYFLFLLLLSPISLKAQANNALFKQAPGGLLYHIYIDKDGPTIQSGDFISMNLTVKNELDSVMYNSYENGHSTVLFVLKAQYPGDINEGLMLLSEGDSAVIKLNVDSLSKAYRDTKPVKGKYVIYNVKVEKVIAKKDLTEKAFNSQVKNYMKFIAGVAKKEEPAKIRKYIADHPLQFKQTSSGLNYAITQKGSGPEVAVGDTAVVNYTGKLINGKVFETNVRSVVMESKMTDSVKKSYVPIRFCVGANKMIQGLEEGVQLLNKGAKATFIISSDLAYGEKGGGAIQPFEPIIFEVELVDIIHPDQN